MGVEAITRGGHVLEGTFESSGTNDVNLTWTHSATTLKRDLLSGDIIRFDDEYRVIQSSKDPDYKLDSPYASAIAANSKGYKQNGMKYDITFEQGCRTHEDCRYNGVDENDSDGPAQKVLYEGGDNNAAYCHNGGTCMCTDGFYGPGCTQTGRGHHANAKVTVSGDAYNLKCDGTVRQENGVTTGLTASYSDFTLAANGVLRTDPLKIITTRSFDLGHTNIAVGDHVRIENQVRTVVRVDGANVWVDRPFEEVATSDTTDLFPRYTPLELITEMGGVRSSCTVTDLRQLTSDNLECNYEAGTATDVRACGRFVVNQVESIAGGVDQKMREVNVGLKLGGGAAKLMDEREVEIGDRIRVLTTAGSWQTRTVDSVTYDTSYQVTGFVVSEPYESESVSTGRSENMAYDEGDKKLTLTNNVGSDFAQDDVVQVDADGTNADGVFTIASAPSGKDIIFTTAGAADVTAAAGTIYKAHLAYNDGAGTTEASECSGRGLCDDSSGECQCFKGYTGVDCSIQNALAV